MRTRWKVLLGLVIVVGIGAAAYQPFVSVWRQRSLPKWKTAEVVRGRLVAVVNSTGTVKPQRQVSVGSFVSGPIDDKVPIAEFNQVVKKGDVLAKIDPRLYQANYERDDATVASRQADVDRAQAIYDQSVRDLERATALRRQDVAFVAQAEMDKLFFSVKQNKAALDVASKAVKQAESQRDNSKANLNYCTIIAPEGGIIIDRKIEPGQTLAAQFQTPELFVLGINMDQAINIHASVDETDIGLIKEAQKKRLPVSFTVYSYPDTLFRGEIQEIRMNSTTTQNVVSYPVVVEAKNPDLKLMPGMTATISFEVDSRDSVLKIPNSALRYFPEKEKRFVRKEDQKLLEGKVETMASGNEEQSENSLSAVDRNELRKKRNQRHVWVADGLFLRAVPVVTGLADGRFTELVSGELKEGDQLVTGVEPPKSAFGP